MFKTKQKNNNKIIYAANQIIIYILIFLRILSFLIVRYKVGLCYVLEIKTQQFLFISLL